MFTTGNEVSSSMISVVGSETVLVVKGKLIRIDHLRNTDIGYFNFEGQKNKSNFPIERQFFHWAAIFASQLQEGDEYKAVTPVSVIVFYKDRGKTRPLIQNAIATGDLLEGLDTQYLNLIAVNTSKWHDADNDKFKHYLALLHYGMDEDILTGAGVDIGDSGFQDLRNKLMYCCAQRTMDEANEKGDEEMEKMMALFLAEKGKEEGILKGKINVYYEEMQLSPEEIAQKMSIPLERVIETINAL